MDVKNCPRCGSDEIAHGWSAPPMEGNVQCFADGCEVIAIAGTERDAVAMWNAGKWNYRVSCYDNNGNPTVVEDAP